MSANFKFQPFGDEEENEEKEKPENPPRQKKTLVPWEISSNHAFAPLMYSPPQVISISIWRTDRLTDRQTDA